MAIKSASKTRRGGKAGNGKAAAADPMKEVRAAWRHAQTAWTHVESSMAELVEAEAALVRSLRVAGTVWTKKARAEAESALKQLEKKRQTATRQLEKLARRYDFIKKPAAKKATAAPAAAPTSEVIS
jgi:dsDNA-specific endonuclease/ATPase MutS2